MFIILILPKNQLEPIIFVNFKIKNCAVLFDICQEQSFYQFYSNIRHNIISLKSMFLPRPLHTIRFPKGKNHLKVMYHTFIAWIHICCISQFVFCVPIEFTIKWNILFPCKFVSLRDKICQTDRQIHCDSKNDNIWKNLFIFFIIFF